MSLNINILLLLEKVELLVATLFTRPSPLKVKYEHTKIINQKTLLMPNIETQATFNEKTYISI